MKNENNLDDLGTMEPEQVIAGMYYYARHKDGDMRIVFVDGKRPFCRLKDCRESIAYDGDYTIIAPVPSVLRALNNAMQPA